MATIIDELAALCAQHPDYAVDVRPADMSVTLTLPGGRRQTVFVQSRLRDDEPSAVLHLRSRAGVVTRADVVRDALRRNANASRAGYALDASARPPALDVVCGLPVDPRQVPVNDFLDALHEVAAVADHVEQSLGRGGDRF